MEGRLDMETSHRPCGRISRSLALAAMRKGEARMRRSKGPKPLRRTPLSDSPARRETPTVLNPSNRRIRTRMYGGVGGEESRASLLSRWQRRFAPTARILKSFRHHDKLFAETAPKPSRKSAIDDTGSIGQPRCSNTGG